MKLAPLVFSFKIMASLSCSPLVVVVLTVWCVDIKAHVLVNLKVLNNRFSLFIHCLLVITLLFVNSVLLSNFKFLRVSPNFSKLFC